VEQYQGFESLPLRCKEQRKRRVLINVNDIVYPFLRRDHEQKVAREVGVNNPFLSAVRNSEKGEF
jgi:hypothetical protein